MNSAVTGFVLNGGRSRRMGAAKAGLIFRGKSLLDHAVENLTALSGGVFVVGGERTPRNRHIPDVLPKRGAPGGIHSALENCPTEFAFILAVDLPLVTAIHIEAIVGIAENAPDCDAVIPMQSDGRPQPLCAVYRTTRCAPVLAKLLAANERASVSDFLALISPKFVEAERIGGDPRWLFNVNTPEELDEISRL